MIIKFLTPSIVSGNPTVSGRSPSGWYEGTLESLFTWRRNGQSAITLGVRLKDGGYRYVDFAPPFEQTITVEGHR